MRSFARAGRCSRRRCSGAGANGRRGRALSVGAAGSPAAPGMAAPRGPRSGRGRKSVTRRPMRACVPAAGSPTWPTAPVYRVSSRSKSLPTSASSAVRGGAGGATARPRPPKCRRPLRRACSQARPVGPACGRASCSSATPASAPCAGSPHGCPTRGSDLCGHAGRQRASVRSLVRAGGRRDPRPPERGGGAPRRRDYLARAVASR